MSMMFCSYCGDLADTDDGEGQFDVPRLNAPPGHVLEYVCGRCVEKYLTEDGKFDADLLEKTQ